MNSVRILIIDHHDSFTYNIKQMMEECHSIPVEVKSFDEVHPSWIEQYRGFVLSPGPYTPADYEYMQWFFPLLDGRKPVLGVCLGHQAIGCYFGADLINLQRVYHGWQTEVEILFPEDPLFKGIQRPLTVGLYHSWALDPKRIPDDLRVTAISREGVIMAIRHRHQPMAGIQFHPESVMTPAGPTIFRNWIESVLQFSVT